MKSYYRIMLGRKSKYAEDAFNGNFIGVEFGLDMDLSNDLPDNLREFNEKYIPILLERGISISKISAGLACSVLWTVAKGIHKHDIVLCPNGKGEYLIGEVLSDYEYHKGEILPHRRVVQWRSETIEKQMMSKPLQNSVGSIGTMCNITKYSEEIENVISANNLSVILTPDETIEDPTVFALEKHLEEFLI